jgi:cell division transport system permease protein
MSGWLARHLHALISSAGNLARAPMATFLTVAVMALALALPQSVLTLVSNTLTATGDFSGSITLTAYLKADVSEQKAQQLARTARARPGVEGVELITATAALAEFRKNSGLGTALDVLPQNPLPHVLIVTPTAERRDRATLETLRTFIAAWPEVDQVQLDSDWVNRVNAILGVLRAVLWVAAALLGAAVVAVVGNTIRLEIQNRRAEIEVTKLVGGTNAFVRRPFLYTGMLYGLAAGVLAWLIVTAALLALRAPVQALARAYGSEFMLHGLGLRELEVLVGVGMALGWLGAWLATARHLARIEPRN